MRVFAHTLNMQYPGFQVLENVQYLEVKFVKGLRHASNGTVLQWQQRFSLTHKRICGERTRVYEMANDLLEFPRDAVFLAPTRSCLCSHALKIHRQRCTRRRHHHASCVRAVPYWKKLSGEIVNTSSMELLKTRLDT